MEASQHLFHAELPVLRTMNSSPISNMPIELLNNILAYAVPEPDHLGRYWRRRQAIAATISLTSKRFHQIVQPMLYHTIHLADIADFDLLPPGQNAKLFFRTIESNPALRGLCKNLTIRLDSEELEEKDLSLCTSLLRWLPNVRSLKVHGGYLSESLLRTALQSMPLVEKLRLSSSYEKVFLAQVCSHFVLPQLRTLELRSPFEGTPSGTVGSIIPQSKKRAALFTALHVSTFQGSPNALQEFLLWPKRLESFSFSGMWWTSVPTPWDWHIIQLLLVPHHSSLKNITIGPICPHHTREVMDFTNFVHLTHLQLSIYDINSTPREAATKLLAAPRLSSLTFDYTVESQHPEAWSSFDETQAKWIRQFASFAKEKPSTLQHIKIQFQPDACEIGYEEDVKDRIYPWDLMDEIRGAIQLLGLNLSYATPTLSKEEFEKRVRGSGELIAQAS